jgi:hypothetical protein
MRAGTGTGQDAKQVHLTGLRTPHKDGKDGVAPPPPLFFKNYFLLFYFFILLFVYNFKYKII